MNPLVILACLVQTAEVGPQLDARCNTPYVRELTTAFTYWAKRYGIPASIEAAKCYHESQFRKHARGTHGEIGICQPKPHGAIQGRDLRLTRRQLEDVNTNIRISTEYLATFVQQCEHPSGWLTKYNRPARGCRPSRYSLGVLADLRAARRIRLRQPSSPYMGSPDSSPAPSSQSSTVDWRMPDRTSDKQEETRSSIPQGTRALLPAGRRRGSETSAQTPEGSAETEDSLAAPFQEP